jgi:hypothetical protein
MGLALGAAPTQVEVTVVGRHEGVKVSLPDTRRQGHLDLVMKGEGAELVNAQLNVSARTVHLEGLLFADSATARGVLRAKVKERFSAERVAFVGNRLAGRAGASLVIVEGGYRAGPIVAGFTDSWWVANAGDGSLLSVVGRNPDTATVELHRVTIAANETSAGIRVPGGAEPSTQDCTIEPPDADRGALEVSARRSALGR